MASKDELSKKVDEFFAGNYQVSSGYTVPEVGEIPLGNAGKEIDLTMLFIDIKESTRIVDGARRQTAAKMYKSFLWGVAQIARMNGGELRSFNGDGVLVAYSGTSKNTDAVRSAMQMSWFINTLIKPKLQSRFLGNQSLQGLDFDFGIGIDTGPVLVVRGGIAGENNNDLVWVGNATNYAVKFSSHSKNYGYNIVISNRVYSDIDASLKSVRQSPFLVGRPIWSNTLTLTLPALNLIYGTNFYIPIR